MNLSRASLSLSSLLIFLSSSDCFSILLYASCRSFSFILYSVRSRITVIARGSPLLSVVKVMITSPGKTVPTLRLQVHWALTDWECSLLFSRLYSCRSSMSNTTSIPLPISSHSLLWGLDKKSRSIFQHFPLSEIRVLSVLKYHKKQFNSLVFI